MKIRLANNWDEVTVGMFRELKHMEQNTDIDVTVGILSILSGQDKNVFYAMDLNELKPLVKEITFMNSLPPKNPVKKTYKINGKRYRLIKDVSYMTAIQFIDYSTLIKNAEKNLHLLLATLLLPEYKHTFRWKCKKYGTYNVMEVAEDIKNHMPITDALTITTFFLRFFKSLVMITETYLTKKILRARKKAEKKKQKEKKKIIPAK